MGGRGGERQRLETAAPKLTAPNVALASLGAENASLRAEIASLRAPGTPPSTTTAAASGLAAAPAAATGPSLDDQLVLALALKPDGGVVHVDSPPPDPQLKGAWFQPLHLSSEKLVSKCAFQIQLAPLHDGSTAKELGRGLRNVAANSQNLGSFRKPSTSDVNKALCRLEIAGRVHGRTQQVTPGDGGGGAPKWTAAAGAPGGGARGGGGGGGGRVWSSLHSAASGISSDCLFPVSTKGRILLLGEGDFTFAVDRVRDNRTRLVECKRVAHIWATSIETAA
jgi:hypothetical protein